ncbi:7-carboxy-7-deazaguanine synthase QueE [Endozoicomonas sp. SM1973]|uniref:7-carboxy-7-deazaguanine synthase n=1 Tax=Spartinivicinus marinus TaxID=2994442 RepID=A0A853I5K8_9GAMM|nr:7-carboxy-7-deazaguanine synthase QueE [Spartinivicinus marinus]MCX4028739.1 7-carboxy-7-deazaguanine synthase QueE [Spartinivicinus marinus]NYZ67999.1 7-carboxy-7-deazaguanine synthase QueE [Spartinivicinus marinus]
MSELKVRISEIFYSLQGETKTIGLPTVFVRLTGCPLRCGYCDTAYAFNGGEVVTVASVLAEVAKYNPRYVTVTGGEPLAQRNCFNLLVELAEQGYEVSLETSGALDVSPVDPRVVKVMDLKAPSSGEMHRNRYENIQWLLPHDQVKFVVANRDDFNWAAFKLAEYDLTAKVSEVLFSPVYGELNPTELAEWILTDNLPVRMQIQLHKYLWNDEPGH